MTAVKICGLKDPDNIRVAVENGADYIGFVFYKDSPRNVDPAAVWDMLRQVELGKTKTVGLFVNPTDKELQAVLSRLQLDMIQLHGDEDPLRIVQIKSAYKLPVMKAMRIGGADDLAQIAKFEACADWLMFDAKVQGQAGGTGKSFDWALLAGQKFNKPWMLSGGLTAENVAEALKILQPAAVDVSSGVEVSRGLKDPAKIRAFLQAVKG